MSACRLRGSTVTQTKKLSDGIGPEVTIDANGHCELPAGMTSVPRDAFWHWDGHRKGCKALRSVGIPSSVTSIGFGAFCNCASLTSVELINELSGAFGVTLSPTVPYDYPTVRELSKHIRSII